MGLTQKYKQQTQQVRVITNESNFLKGMYYTDAPLSEGFVRTIINFDIDSMSGKLTPRKGLQSLGIVTPDNAALPYLDAERGFTSIVASRVCSASDSTDPRKINRLLQAVLYNTATRGLGIVTTTPEVVDNATFAIIPFTMNSSEEYVTPEPYVIEHPGIHNKACIHNQFFTKPVGTFAFGNNYYTFLKRFRYSITKIADLPNAEYIRNDGQGIIENYTDLVEHSDYTTGETGKYFKFVSGISQGVLAYYDEQGAVQLWDRSEEELQRAIFPVSGSDLTYKLCYTKLGQDVQPDDILLDNTLTRPLEPDKYYTCEVAPQRLNPTEASSWGYNMLLKEPYDFECESTAVNMVTILGIIPYAKDSTRPVLTPRKNQEITLKAFYRMPNKYWSDARNAKFYATTKYAAAFSDLANHSYGDWYYDSESGKYYIVVPTYDVNEQGTITNIGKAIKEFGVTKPAASEKLGGRYNNDSGNGDRIRIRWQMKTSASSGWTDLYNEITTIPEYTAYHGELAPFTLTTTMPQEDVLIRLTISDVADTVADEEYVLSTNTIGLSLVSDELANTLNLDAKTFELGDCTGMCEWGQRIVLWGVPEALNTLFISDVNNPSYFPYPNNIDIFTDPIIAVHNYGDELLVLTTSALYRLTWDTEGSGWTHKLVQQNLHVTEADTYMSCVIKNMFFFKSGELYYMMVPKASSTSSVQGEVAIAPVSKPIEYLLNNFHTEIYALISMICDQYNMADFTDKLVNYFSYVDNTKVVVNYVYALDETTAETTVQDTETSKYLYVQLIYDTDIRTWSMRAFEAPHMLYASHADAIQQDRFIDVTPTLYNGQQLTLQYFKFKDLSDNAVQYIDDENTAQTSVKILKNYQYLDTGNREINTELKKRFREFQFKIKNNTNTNLGFFTSFLVDGSLRKDLQPYSPRLISDPDSDELTIVVERTLDVSTMTYRTTRVERVILPKRMLQDDGELTPTTLAHEDDPDRWILNQSAFPGRTLWKIRMPISGKGYTPRAILLSTNEASYELLGDSWVYRTMNGR